MWSGLGGKRMKVSTWAGLHNRQVELDFVDIDTDRDTRLFVDPYAIDIRGDAWSAKCSRHLRSYFSALINALRSGANAKAVHLASHLGEADETFLGMSSGRPQGRGIGSGQAIQLLQALQSSRAVQTGLLSELADTELFIEGIGPDKISDLTSNVIRGPLLEYTRQQAELWGMPLTQEVVVGPVWNPRTEDWEQAPRTTIVIRGVPVILVPKFSVRRRLSLNSQEFYNHHMTGFLQQEYLYAGQSLVTVLKSGEQRVYKKDVRERHPFIKSDLAAFVQEHPDILEQYKRLAGAKGSLESSEIERGFDEKEYANRLIDELVNIPTGNKHASEYHKFCIGALTFLMYPDLITPVKEREIDQGRKRIDISYTNAARSGFFDMALRSQQMRSIEVPVECKNYQSDISNPELDQLTNRFSHTRGFLGLLCCRSFDKKDRFVARCRDAAVNRGQYAIVLDDGDLRHMLANVSEGKRTDNDRFLTRRYHELTS